MGSWVCYSKVVETGRETLYPIELKRPAVNFFEGVLLGNGGMGVVVRTRPDAVMLHFGHNNIWDIRIAEEHKDDFGKFSNILKRLEAIPDSIEDIFSVEWYRDYRKMCHENYKHSFPRPFPCGSLVLAFDRREVELTGHKLDISNGLCEVNLIVGESRNVRLQIFAEMISDRVWIRLVDEDNKPASNCFNRIQILPDPSTPDEFPLPIDENEFKDGMISFTQILPARIQSANTDPKSDLANRAFRLAARVNQAMDKSFYIDTRSAEKVYFDGHLSGPGPLVIVTQLEEGTAEDVTHVRKEIPRVNQENFETAFQQAAKNWQSYWSCSAVHLDDPFLEKIWYWNSYFFNCAVKAGTVCPGLFANWSYKNIGTAWHGDYHLNYNWQQPFWFTFSSNHLDKNIPYIDAVYHMLPVSRQWAKEYYGLRGAFFPHSAYPVTMTVHPYPCPDWGWEICETPWAVQGLWWHYLYSMDIEFLKERLYPPIRDAVLFLVDYMKRPAAHGQQWGDDKYHIYPTVVPELYAHTNLPHLKYDCLVDLTLTKFIFKAYLSAVQTLRITDKETVLISDVRDILANFPEYQVVESGQYGRVLVSVPGENAEIVYNIPNSLVTVFPGEEHGLSTSPDTLNILKNSLANLQVEGGNEVVFQHLQAARLGMLDLEKFKRQVNYCLLPNGSVTNKVLQALGRYSDRTEFDFMAPMGIWFENFSLPAVINECLMQSYDGVIRLFPNWPAGKDASFSSLRAVGAFLVSASQKNGEVGTIEIESEQGSGLTLMIPWKEGAVISSNYGTWQTEQTILKMKTEKSEKIRLVKRTEE